MYGDSAAGDVGAISAIGGGGSVEALIRWRTPAHTIMPSDSCIRASNGEHQWESECRKVRRTAT